MIIREMTPEEWTDVRLFYKGRYGRRESTFRIEIPQWEAWNASHREIAGLFRS
jgi:L-amino acid N-acyltransferase YncA